MVRYGVSIVGANTEDRVYSQSVITRTTPYGVSGTLYAWRSGGTRGMNYSNEKIFKTPTA